MANEYVANNNNRRYDKTPANHQSVNVPRRNSGQMPDNKPNIAMRKNMPKRGSAPKIIIGAVCILFLLSYVIYGKSETNKLYVEIAEASKKEEMLDSDNKRMKTELEKEMSLKVVEDYAENVLGLSKLEKSQIEYIEVQTDNRVEIMEEDSNIFVKIKKTFEDIMEYIFD